MELNKHSFPVNITLEDAISKFQKEFDKKGHKVKIQKDQLHLNITPYWVCFYDIDSNKDGNYQHLSGQIALNSLTNKVENEYLKILDVSTPQCIDALDVSFERVEIRVKKSLINQAEAQETITKILSSKYNVDRKNISLSGFEEMYIPIWRIDLEDHELNMDAVTGKINNFHTINKKSRSNSELFTEMVDEIRTPKGLAKYISEFLTNVFNIIKYIFVLFIKYWQIVLIVILAIFIGYLILF